MTLYYEGIARMPLADAVGLPAPTCFQMADLASWVCCLTRTQGAALLPLPVVVHCDKLT